MSIKKFNDFRLHEYRDFWGTLVGETWIGHDNGLFYIRLAGNYSSNFAFLGHRRGYDYHLRSRQGFLRLDEAEKHLEETSEGYIMRAVRRSRRKIFSRADPHFTTFPVNTRDMEKPDSGKPATYLNGRA